MYGEAASYMMSYGSSEDCICSTLLLRNIVMDSWRYRASLLKSVMKNLLVWIVTNRTVYSSQAMLMLSIERYSVIKQF